MTARPLPPDTLRLIEEALKEANRFLWQAESWNVSEAVRNARAAREQVAAALAALRASSSDQDEGEA